ncbi:hypothetical protein FCU45_00635 [Sulfurimonas crateris]|uniref:Uncharacterized protein n=1 Tax=Sulfurimonas crateris TaxID=2574727 RepID=A0A4U2ZBK4_9BACT|nr:hypothetical protein [Sulfurimonas crateris]TKI70930.1 hypothetical protein FCU45_00635 [Sulfurimonas crateris]
MNFKKIWLFLLLSTISFSVVHDYAFAKLKDDHYFLSSYIHKALLSASDEKSAILCELHTEYHSAFLFVEKLSYTPVVQEKDELFKYSKTFISLAYFNFFKPPIA